MDDQLTCRASEKLYILMPLLRNTSVAIVKPEDFERGAWQVRMTTRTSAAENHLEDVPLAFPQAASRLFMPGTLYGALVLNLSTFNYEQGFRFLSGYIEFYMYSNGRPEDDNESQPGWLSSCQLKWIRNSQAAADELSNRS